MSQEINIKRIKFFKFKDGYGNPLFILDEGFKINDVFYDALGCKMGNLTELKNYVDFCGCKFGERAFHEWCDLDEDEMESIVKANYFILNSSLSK